MKIVLGKSILAILASILALILSQIACGQQIALTPTPTPPPVVLTPTPTARPSVSASPAPSPTPAQVAAVMAAVVNVRLEPDGERTGKYIYAGQEITILEYSKDGKWARIAEPPGWVYVGCLSVESDLRCEAK